MLQRWGGGQRRRYVIDNRLIWLRVISYITDTPDPPSEDFRNFVHSSKWNDTHV